MKEKNFIYTISKQGQIHRNKYNKKVQDLYIKSYKTLLK